MKHLIYLDHASTTPVDPAVAGIMRTVLEESFGNPSSGHRRGLDAARQIERARAILAGILDADPDEILFTSGGTESNNLALKGLALAADGRRGHLVVSAIEHPSVLACADWLGRSGFDVTTVPVDGMGFVDPDDVRRAIRPDTCVVSVAPANHEVGTVQPLQAIGRICTEAGVPLHTDACQAFTRLPLGTGAGAPDLVSLNAHKIHGPKGVGALRVRRGLRLEPLLHGGGQEGGLRSGTPNTPAVAGFGKAVQIASPADNDRLAGLRDAFILRVLGTIPGARLHGPRAPRLCNNVNLGFARVSGRDLAAALDREGIRVSRGSACASGSTRPSPVLLALGLSQAEALGAIRITLGRGTTAAHLDAAADALERLVRVLVPAA